MKCFNHPDKDAVGMCNCRKFLCHECCHPESSVGVVCGPECKAKAERVLKISEEVSEVPGMVNRVNQEAKRRQKRLAIVFAVINVLTILMAISLGFLVSRITARLK